MRTRILLTLMVLAIFSACNNSETTTAKTDTTAAPPPVDTPVVAAPAAEAPVDPTVQLVQLTLRDQLKADLEKGLVDSLSRSFKYASYDLNGDGNKEIFVGLTGPNFCGSGGCTQYLLDHQGNVITRFTVSDYPVVVDSKKTKDWSDLFILSGGKHHIMKFDGKKYPSNPSTQPVLKLTPGDDLPRMLVWENTPSYTF